MNNYHLKLSAQLCSVISHFVQVNHLWQFLVEKWEHHQLQHNIQTYPTMCMTMSIC